MRRRCRRTHLNGLEEAHDEPHVKREQMHAADVGEDLAASARCAARWRTVYHRSERGAETEEEGLHGMSVLHHQLARQLAEGRRASAAMPKGAAWRWCTLCTYLSRRSYARGNVEKEAY